LGLIGRFEVPDAAVSFVFHPRQHSQVPTHCKTVGPDDDNPIKYALGHYQNAKYEFASSKMLEKRLRLTPAFFIDYLSIAAIDASEHVFNVASSSYRAKYEFASSNTTRTTFACFVWKLAPLANE
jgi:hypothetical protein